MNASILFADGLRLIFGYLETDEFLIAVTQVCQSWYAAGRSSSSPCRSIAFKIYSSTNLPHLSAAASSPLNRHLTSLSITFTPNTSTFTVATAPDVWPPIVSLLPHFPSLTQLRLEPLSLQLDLTPLLSCPRLTYIILPSYGSSIRQVMKINHKFHLKITSPYPGSLLTHLIRHMRTLASLPHLTRLELIEEQDVVRHGYNVFDIIIPTLAHNQICFPRLVVFPIFSMSVTRKSAENLFYLFPSLTDLAPRTITADAVPIVLQWTQLRRLALNETFLSLLKQQPDLLAPLHHLEHLAFLQRCPRPDQLIHLFITLPLLSSLAFESMSSFLVTTNWPLDILIPSDDLRAIFTERLRSLRFYSTQLDHFQIVPSIIASYPYLTSLELIDALHHSMKLEQLRAAFSSPYDMPQLQRLELVVKETGSDVDAFLWTAGQRSKDNFRRRKASESENREK